MLKVLKENIIFKKIEDSRINEILNQIKYERKEYKKKEFIVFRGDKVEGLNIILRGIVSAEMLTVEGNIKKIEDLGVGEILASAFIFGKNNSFPVDLVAIEDTEILFINKENFLKLLSLKNSILENFLDEISNKTQFLTNRIWSNFNNKTIGEKIVDYIKKKQNNGEITLESLTSLANFFGVARPSLSRVLSEYVKEKKLERIGRNKYLILDKDFFS